MFDLGMVDPGMVDRLGRVLSFVRHAARCLSGRTRLSARAHFSTGSTDFTT